MVVAGRVVLRVAATLAGRLAAASATGPRRVVMLEVVDLPRVGADAFLLGANDPAPRVVDALIAAVDLPSLGPDVLRFAGSLGDSGILRFSPATVDATPKADRVTGFGMPLGMPDALVGDPPTLGSRDAGGCGVSGCDEEQRRAVKSLTTFSCPSDMTVVSV